jgi:hypothetical protein
LPKQAKEDDEREEALREEEEDRDELLEDDELELLLADELLFTVQSEVHFGFFGVFQLHCSPAPASHSLPSGVHALPV